MVRVAVVYFSKKSGPGSDALAKSFAQALEKRGATVDVMDGAKSRDVKLTGYHYIAVGTDVRAIFGGKLPPEVKGFLANSGIVSGKRCVAWVKSSTMGTQRTLLNLMKSMEAEGMLLRTSEIFASLDDARSAGEHAKIDGLPVS